jgi:hypothetical protein
MNNEAVSDCPHVYLQNHLVVHLQLLQVLLHLPDPTFCFLNI